MPVDHPPVSGDFVRPLAGSGVAEHRDGTGAGASFQSIEGLAYDPATENVYVTSGNTIRKVSYKTGVVTTIAGSPSPNPDGKFYDGDFKHAIFSEPRQIVLEFQHDGPDFAQREVADNKREQEIKKNAMKQVAASSAAPAPAAPAPAKPSAGAYVHSVIIADSGNNRVRKLTLAPDEGRLPACCRLLVTFCF